jgi:hypothetical protein
MCAASLEVIECLEAVDRGECLWEDAEREGPHRLGRRGVIFEELHVRQCPILNGKHVSANLLDEEQADKALRIVGLVDWEAGVARCETVC